MPCGLLLGPPFKATKPSRQLPEDLKRKQPATLREAVWPAVFYVRKLNAINAFRMEWCQKSTRTLRLSYCFIDQSYRYMERWTNKKTNKTKDVLKISRLFAQNFGFSPENQGSFRIAASILLNPLSSIMRKRQDPPERSAHSSPTSRFSLASSALAICEPLYSITR